MRLATSVAVVAASGVIGLTLGHHTHHEPPAPVSSTPAVPPDGWTEECERAAIGLVCHTYPPGDDRAEPSPPVPPQRPLPTPWPGGEDAR